MERKNNQTPKEVDFEKVAGRIAVALAYCFLAAYGPGFLWQISHMAAILMIVAEVLLVLGFLTWFMLFIEPTLPRYVDEEEKKEGEK